MLLLKRSHVRFGRGCLLRLIQALLILLFVSSGGAKDVAAGVQSSVKTDLVYVD